MQNEETKKEKRALFWFRNDLRLEDNVGLYQALSEYDSVACVYIFDKVFLSSLKKKDLTMDFLYLAVLDLKNKLKQLGSDLMIRIGNPSLDIPEIAKSFQVDAVYTNKIFLHEEQLKEDIIERNLYSKDIGFCSFKDSVVFSPDDILDQNGEPYKDFSQYKDVWSNIIKNEDLKTVSPISLKENFAKFSTKANYPKLEQFGFIPSKLSEMKMKVSTEGAIEQFSKFRDKLQRYPVIRDIPHYAGVSYMSIYIRFGLISVRTLLKSASTYIKDLKEIEKDDARFWIEQWIKREYLIQKYYHNPTLFKLPYKKHYAKMKWDNNMQLYNAWCNAETGYPIIDAAMKQLEKTGYMHQRLRQIVASFVTKVLFIDYRYGEAFFAVNLLDYDKVSNNMGWQWAASVNDEATEYIQMFDPSENSRRFDANAQYIRKYLPHLAKIPSKYLHEPWLYETEIKEFGVVLGENYPKRIVDYKQRRNLVLAKYEEINKLN